MIIPLVLPFALICAPSGAPVIPIIRIAKGRENISYNFIFAMFFIFVDAFD